ncbi:MAG: hypothetical protein AAFX94_19155, partial [Myxococcota bacterium]
SSGWYIVTVSDDLNNLAPCVDSNQINRRRLSGQNEQLLRVALAAHLAGKSVDIWGSNSCDEWSGIESLSRIRTLP